MSLSPSYLATKVFSHTTLIFLVDPLDIVSNYPSYQDFCRYLSRSVSLSPSYLATKVFSHTTLIFLVDPLDIVSSYPSYQDF